MKTFSCKKGDRICVGDITVEVVAVLDDQIQLGGQGSGKSASANQRSEETRIPQIPSTMGGSYMTLPGKDEKGYLKIVNAGSGFYIAADKRHAEDLQPLLAQHGIPCVRRRDVEPGKDLLVFDDKVDRRQVQEILDEYEQAKGS